MTDAKWHFGTFLCLLLSIANFVFCSYRSFFHVELWFRDSMVIMKLGCKISSWIQFMNPTNKKVIKSGISFSLFKHWWGNAANYQLLDLMEVASNSLSYYSDHLSYVRTRQVNVCFCFVLIMYTSLPSLKYHVQSKGSEYICECSWRSMTFVTCWLLVVKKALFKHSLVTVSISEAQNKHHFLVEGGFLR